MSDPIFRLSKGLQQHPSQRCRERVHRLRRCRMGSPRKAKALSVAIAPKPRPKACPGPNRFEIRNDTAMRITKEIQKVFDGELGDSIG